MFIIILSFIYFTVSLLIALIIYHGSMQELSRYSNQLKSLYENRAQAETFEEKSFWRNEILAFTKKEHLNEEIIDLEKHVDRKTIITVTSVFMGVLWLPIAITQLAKSVQKML